MKCSQCGNEVNPGAVCSVCGKAAPVDDVPTMASEPIISVKVSGNNAGQSAAPTDQGMQQMNGQNNPYMGNNTMGQAPYQGGPTPYQNGQAPYQGSQAPYQGGPTSYQGSQTPYQGGPMPYQNGQTSYQGGNIPPEPKKSKTPFIVAGVILAVAVVAIIILIVLIVGGKDDKDKDKDKTTETTTVVTTEATTEDITAEDTTTEEATDAPISSDPGNGNGSGGSGDTSQLEGEIVYEDEYVALTLTIPEMDSYNELYAYGQILNKTSNEINVSNTACSLDGICVDGYMYATIPAGSIEDIDLTIYGADLEESGITHIDNIDVCIYGTDSASFEKIFNGIFSLSCNIDTGCEPLFDTSGYTTIYEDSYVLVKASNDIWHDSVYGAYYSYLYIESKVDDVTSVMLTDTYIDGELVAEHGGWEDIAPKAAVYADVYWYEDDLGDNPAFSTITMDLDFFNYFTWDDYTEQTIEY